MQVLLVDHERARRLLWQGLLARQDVRYFEAIHSMDALAALGRADFDTLLVAEEKRLLSLRGLIQLAGKRHPGIRVLVLAAPGTDAGALAAALGGGLEVVPAGEPLEVTWARLAAPAPAPPSRVSPRPPDVTAAPPLPVVVPARVAAPKPPAPAPAPVDLPAGPLQIEGQLEDAAGAALLMGLFAQELTGRLTLPEGPAAGTLYLLRGEPVYATLPDGDAGLFRRLRELGVVPPGTPAPAVAEGTLLAALSAVADAEKLQAALRALVRERVLALLGQRAGAYQFREDHAFVDVVPLMKVNPLGLLVETRRREMTPDALLARSNEMQKLFLHPGPGLAAAAKRLTPFMRGADIMQVVRGTTTMEAFCLQSGLGQLMGTVLALVLTEARLATLQEAPFAVNSSSIVLRDKVRRSAEEPAPPQVQVPDADAPADEETPEFRALQKEIFSLYTRIKPITVPRVVLGVTPYANRADIDRAYAALAAQADPRRIPDSPGRPVLEARMEEIRHKLDACYQALAASLVDDDPDNPF
ncbi:MAG: hypothetical protein HY904_18665 [Deltaproteobacteria bacterium]|nr:hypothetical protein [Deltaproteobacteria bacterium]